jgi:hypothetical protein
LPGACIPQAADWHNDIGADLVGGNDGLLTSTAGGVYIIQVGIGAFGS